MKKKVLAALLAVCMVASMLMPAAAATTFTDVDADAWYASSIERWTKYGILNGVGENSFNPTGDMTRAQFAKVVVTMLGLPVDEDAECPFEDVKGTNEAWAIPYIVAAYKAGIINGASDTQFNPNSGNTVSFDQAAAILARALGLVAPDAYGEKVTEKLTELGMLDDNVKADADMNRALVAALADNMIGVYVTPETVEDVTEDGVITGEVKGVVLVVAGADGVAVTVKDATVSAIVMNGGNVTVSGETTVDTVKVGGGNAIVVAEEGTTVGAVTVEGTNASVALDGEVESVTVAKDATVSKLEGAGVSSENVTNESAEDVKVNDETVEGKPVEENPGEDKDDTNEDYENWDGGFTASPDTKLPTDATTGNGGDAATDNRKPDSDDIPAVEDADGEVKVDTENGKVACAEGAHTWNSGKVTKNPSCTETGTVTYTCTATTCQATKTGTIAKLAHDFDGSRVAYDTDNHWTLCKYCPQIEQTTGEGAGDKKTPHTLKYTNKGEKHTATCSCGYTKSDVHAPAADGAEYTHDANKHYTTCEGCGTLISKAHEWSNWTDKVSAPVEDEEVQPQAETETDTDAEPETVMQERTCTVCGRKETRVKPEGGDTPAPSGHSHAWNTAWKNNNTHHWHECKNEDGKCSLTANAASEDKDGYGTHVWTKKAGTCDTCSMACPSTSTHANLYTPQACSTCGKQGAKDVETCTNKDSHASCTETACTVCGYQAPATPPQG